MSLIDRLTAATKNEAARIRQKAMQTYVSASRTGSCAERRRKILAVLPDASRFSTYARDIYVEGHDREMARMAVQELDLPGGGRAYRDPVGERYAEMRRDPGLNEVVVVFRGTRPFVETDWLADLTQHFGFGSGYYEWAAWLVGRIRNEYPSAEVIAVGQSLGGGLAIYAVLRNPGAKAFVFNPAGLSKSVWQQESPLDRARANAAITVFATRNKTEIEPVTALSFAGSSVTPGHIFVVDSEEPELARLHSATGMVSALQRLQANKVAGNVCDGDVGVLADPNL